MSRNMGSRSASGGSTLVEFALITLVLMTLFMGAFDFGYAVYAYNTISLAAREGARYAIICKHSDSQVEAWVAGEAVGLTNLQINVDPKPTSNSMSCQPADRNHGDRVTVTVTYDYRPWTLLIAQALGVSTLRLSAQSTMVVE